MADVDDDPSEVANREDPKGRLLLQADQHLLLSLKEATEDDFRHFLQ